jgi:hypothetical protein
MNHPYIVPPLQPFSPRATSQPFLRPDMQRDMHSDFQTYPPVKDYNPCCDCCPTCCENLCDCNHINFLGCCCLWYYLEK